MMTEIIMLPANKKTGLCLEFNKLVLDRTSLINCTQSWQHLYFLSDEKPKEGDLILYIVHCSDRLSDFDTINEKALVMQYNPVVHQNIRYCKKIVATNDSSLEKLLAHPSPDFIKVYVDSYNAGTPIKWVNLEYEGGCCGKCIDGVDECLPSEIKLKVNSKNEISIQKLNDSFPRNKVIELLKLALTHKDDGMIGSLVTAQNEIREANFDHWISLNL